MKKIYNNTTLIFMLAMLTGMIVAANTAHAQTASELHGIWTIDFGKMNISANSAAGFDYNARPEASKTRIRQAFESRTYTFNTDQTAVISFAVGGNNKQFNGTWSYNASSNRLTITIGGDAVEYQTTLQGTDLTLAPLVLKANAVYKSFSLTKN